MQRTCIALGFISRPSLRLTSPAKHLRHRLITSPTASRSPRGLKQPPSGCPLNMSVLRISGWPTVVISFPRRILGASAGSHCSIQSLNASVLPCNTPLDATVAEALDAGDALGDARGSYPTGPRSGSRARLLRTEPRPCRSGRPICPMQHMLETSFVEEPPWGLRTEASSPAILAGSNGPPTTYTAEALPNAASGQT